jgi:signal transduction histidine kinase
MGFLTVNSSFFSCSSSIIRKTIRRRFVTKNIRQLPLQSSLTRLTSGIFFIHALSTPLSSLLINLDLCLEALAQTPATPRVYLEQAILDVQHIQALLSVVKPTPKNHKLSFEVKAAVQEVIIRRHQPWHQQNVLAHIQLPSDLKLPGHPFYFQEALTCLINNGFEAYGTARHKMVTVACFKRKNQIIMHITDSGKGMSWPELQLITVRHLSFKPHHTGIGLSFVKQIISTYYHGRFFVHSTRGGGTTITLIIPHKH